MYQGKKVNFSQLMEKVKEIVDMHGEREWKMLSVCRLLRENVPHYNWVGFYFVDPNREDELVLGPFSGEPTEHVRIKFGEGICGQAAERKITFIVQDVSKEKNYLSCSPKVKSEMVVPIFKKGKLVGELDIDSHYPESFVEDDKRFLQLLCAYISKLF